MEQKHALASQKKSPSKMMRVPVVTAIVVGCIQACQAVAGDVDIASLATALQGFETKFERQGLAMQAQLDAQHTKFDWQGSAMQAQLDAQQTDIFALKADNRGKEQRIQWAQALLAQHVKRLESLLAQNKDQQAQIDRCSTGEEPNNVEPESGQRRSQLGAEQMSRRRSQQQEAAVCGPEALENMLAVCCRTRQGTATGCCKAMGVMLPSRRRVQCSARLSLFRFSKAVKGSH
jgi:hypothetical protein